MTTLDVTTLTDDEVDALTTAQLDEISEDELDRQIARAARKLGYAHVPEDLLEEQLTNETADDLETLGAMAYKWPLSMAQMWSKDEAVTDQRRAVCALKNALVLMLLGGNRSGKSQAGKFLTVAMALGGDHPAVRAWIIDNDLPHDLIPDGPGEVFAVALSAADSVRYHRQDIDDLLPRDETTWRMRNVPQEALAEIAVPGYKKKAKIWFKAVEQKEKSFRGAKVRFVWFDEEPAGEEGKLVYEESARAVADQGGQVMFTFTPHLGFTWTFDELVQSPAAGTVVLELDSLNNTMVDDPASLRRWIESLSPEQQLMRRFGKYTDLRGLIYDAFTRGDGTRDGPGNLCDPFEIPEQWPRFMGVDWGIKNPTAVVWAALGDDGCLYVYREHVEAGPSYEEHAIHCHGLMGNELAEDGTLLEVNEPIECGWADPAGKKAIETWEELDIYLERADNEVKTGIDAVRNLLRLWPDGRPRLKIFTGLPNIVRELEGYRWSSKTILPTPVKKNDHAVDALRYLVMGINEWRGA